MRIDDGNLLKTCRLAAGVIFLVLAVAGSGGCSSEKPKKNDEFIQRLDRDADLYVQKNKQRREAEAVRRRTQEEQYRRRLAEEARRASLPPAATAATPAQTADNGPQYILSDKDLSFIVLNKLRLLQKRSTVSISCKDGVVQLFGEVGSEEEKQHIIKEIKKLPGVLRLDASELMVTGQP